MEHETYFATAAQLLPVVALAGIIELRQIIKTIKYLGDFESQSWATRTIAEFWPRLLAASTLACLILTGTCIEALYTGDPPGWLYPVLSNVLPYTLGLIGVPLLGALVKPTFLISWYDDPPPESNATATSSGSQKRRAVYAARSRGPRTRRP